MSIILYYLWVLQQAIDNASTFIKYKGFQGYVPIVVTRHRYLYNYDNLYMALYFCCLKIMRAPKFLYAGIQSIPELSLVEPRELLVFKTYEKCFNNKGVYEVYYVDHNGSLFRDVPKGFKCLAYLQTNTNEFIDLSDAYNCYGKIMKKFGDLTIQDFVDVAIVSVKNKDKVDKVFRDLHVLDTDGDIKCFNLQGNI